jgi:hypothetical protein
MRAPSREAGVPFFRDPELRGLSSSRASPCAILRGCAEAGRPRHLHRRDRRDRRAPRRGVVSNDEREQTLSQLLAEMDGFDPAVGAWA